LKIEVLSSDKNQVEFKLVGERHTFAQLLKHYLLKHSDVEFASYKLNHPFDNETLFIVRTKKGKPSKVLLEVNKEILQDLADFKKKVKEAFK